MALTGRPPDPANADTLATAVRLQRPIYDRLVAESNRRCVSRNLIINRAVTEWLDRAELISLGQALAQSEDPHA